MSTNLSSASNPPQTPAGVGRVVAVGLAAWFLVVIVLGARGAFVAPPGSPPLPILLGFTVPLAAFFMGLWLWQSFRAFVLSADLRLLTGIQAWRFAGLGFIALYAYRVLPGGFAWPAGLGDIAIGLTAPWLVFVLDRRPGFAASKTFAAWNVLGVLDLIVAVGSGAVHSMLATEVPGEVTTAPMALLPLLLIPAYLVPLFLMLHTAALLQARATARSGQQAIYIAP